MPHTDLAKGWWRTAINRIRAWRVRLSANPRHTYSQLGEDICIIHYFDGYRGGRYVDVGCHYPFRLSNTAALHKTFGWSGINIDADSDVIEAFKLVRPHDVNLNVAVGPEDREIEFAVFRESAVNSAVPEDYEAKRAAFGDPIMRRVRMTPLQKILENHIPPGETFDFLNVDVEGMDLQVLKSLDWMAHRPKVVAVEIHGLDLSNVGSSETVHFMQELGYKLRSFCVATAIFVR